MDHRPIILTLSTLLAGLFATAQAADPATGWWPPFVPAVPPPAVAAPAPVAGATETLVLDAYEAAGLSGFRKDWNRPIPLAADGAMTKRTDETVNFGAGPVADWDAPDKPGALACDAVHRSLLLRFPGAAERIAAALQQGKRTPSRPICEPPNDVPVALAVQARAAMMRGDKAAAVELQSKAVSLASDPAAKAALDAYQQGNLP